MDLRFEPIILPRDQERLIQFLTSEEWPFHVNLRLECATVEKMIEENYP